VDNICLGTVQLGMNYGISNQSGKPDYNEVLRIIGSAVQNDIVFFDTAQAYGNSELILGKAFRELNLLNRVKVISKLSPEFEYSCTQKLRESIDQSLENLHITTLWGLMTHRSGTIRDWQKFSGDIEIFREKKKVKFIGTSVYSPEEALIFAKNDYIDIIQVPVNILDNRLLHNGFFEIAAHRKKKVFIRSVFLQGLLLMSDTELVEKDMGWASEYLVYYRSFLMKHNLIPQYFALKAIKQKFPESVIITGVEHQTQLLENLKLLRSPDIDSSIIDEWWSKLPEMPERLLNPTKWVI
jgi:aryl-alcohol dehydrogenase-like predicted oxidoreductase